MSILEGLTGYYSNFGVRGVLAISAYRLCGRPKEITVHPPAIRNPIHIRVRTNDVSVYSEVFPREGYGFDLGFSPKTIVDAGASTGMVSIYFAHKYPEAKIIAMEAEPPKFAVLARNVQHYPAIIPVHAALWNRDGEIRVSELDSANPAAEKNVSVSPEGPDVKVRAITMPTLMKEMQLRSVDLLKMDMEGAEKEVFEACDWMDAVNCLMIELHDKFKPGCSAAVNSVAREFSKSQRGDTTLYIRERDTCGNAV